MAAKKIAAAIALAKESEKIARHFCCPSSKRLACQRRRISGAKKQKNGEGRKGKAEEEIGRRKGEAEDT